jgi:hypothetical protein
MAITTLAQMETAPRQRIQFQKTIVSIGTIYEDLFSQAGAPGTGTNVNNIVSGVLPLDTDAGYPNLNSFNGGTGYLSRVEFTSGLLTPAGQMQAALFDTLYAIGPVAWNSTSPIVLTGQTDYSGRLPNSDYGETEIWMVNVASGTGAPLLAITYMNQDSVSGQVTNTLAPGANGSSGATRFSLAAGDTGVKKIERVTLSGTLSGGTWNIYVMRRLAHISDARSTPGTGVFQNAVQMGMPIIYQHSALKPLWFTGPTVRGNELFIDVVSG